VFSRLRSSTALVFGEKRFQFLATTTQWSSVFCYAITIGVSWIHAIDDVVGERSHDHVDFCPVVDALVLLLVEVAYFLVLYGFELKNRR
jgi:hypothetical protein